MLANDSDIEGDELFFVSAFDGFNGEVSFEGTTITFIPRGDFFGNAEFTYTVRDANGAESSGTVFLLITPENDAPIALDDQGLAIAEDTFIDFDPADLLLNDVDPMAMRSVSMGSWRLRAEV